MKPQDLQWLLNCADRLAQTQRVPIAVDKIVHGLGIRIRRVRHERSKAAELMREASGHYEIVLFSGARRSGASRGERFTLAHELGHALIDARSGWIPSDNREYFEREQWCHRFAARLLVPQDLVRRISIHQPRTAIRNLLWLSRTCDVSRPVAGWRLAESFTGFGFAEFEFGIDAKHAHVLRTVWSAPDMPELGLTRRKMMRSTNPVYEAARVAEGPNRIHQATIDGTVVTICRSVQRPGHYLAHLALDVVRSEESEESGNPKAELVPAAA